MLIYVNGDSFNAGTGLADHIILKDYTPSPQTPGKGFDHSWAGLRHTLAETYGLTDALDVANLERAWPSHLQKLIGSPVINGSQGASSIKGIADRTVYDLEKLSSEGQCPDYVFIGITSIERLGLVNTQHLRNPAAWTDSALPSHHGHLTKSQILYAKTFWRTHGDEEMLIHFLRECLLIKSYVNLKTGKDPIFLNTSGKWDHILPMVKTTKLEMITFLWNLLKFDEVFSILGFGEFGKQHPMCVDGHWSEPAHVAYAQYLATTFITN